MRSARGFTLIELLTVIVVIGILTAIAVPSFMGQIRKSRRSEAMQAVSDLQLRQERWRASRTSYTTTLSDLNAIANLPSGYYTLSTSTPASLGTCTCSTATCYQFTATTAGSQTSDSECATIVLTNRCGTITKTSTPSGNTCWR